MVKPHLVGRGIFYAQNPVLNQTEGKIIENFRNFQEKRRKFLNKLFLKCRICPIIRRMEDFKERLLSFIQAKEMSVRKFEETCGLTNGTIGSIKAQGPTALVVSKISDSFQDLDMNWLFRGTGSMFISQDIQPSRTVQNDIHHNDTVNINYVALKDAIVDAIRESRRKSKE